MIESNRGEHSHIGIDDIRGIEAPTETAQTFVDAFLASGAYTQASFAQAVSSLAQVDMVGLGLTGLDYLY